MRKLTVAAITVAALTLTACTSDNVGDDNTAGAVAQTDRGTDHNDPSADTGENPAEQAAQEELDQALLDSHGASDWSEADEGWASSVTGTDVNAGTLLIYTTLDPNDGSAVDDAEMIAGEAYSVIAGEQAADDLTKVTVSYQGGRGAHTEQINDR